MLAGTGARRSGAIAGAATPNLQRSLRPRQFSSFTAARNLQPTWRPAARTGLVSRGHNHVFSHPSLLASPRFLSSAAATSAPETSAAPATVIDNGVQSVEALSDGSHAALDLTQTADHLGYLKELGLDYGWGPSSMIEMFLESLHIYGHLPWVGSAVTAAVLIRLVLFKSILTASHTSAQIRVITPLTKPIQERMLQAVRSGNNLEGLKAKQELAMIREQHGVKLWKTFVPMLQIPLGFGMFRVLRGMSSLPVPGLLTEKFLWINDVTLADPYYILPMCTGAFLYISLKRGGETGVEFANSPLGKFMRWGLPIISASAMCFWPAVLQLYFASTGLIGVCQAYLITSPGFRKLVGVAPLVKAAPKDSDSPADSGPASRIRVIPTTGRVVPEKQNPGQEVHIPENISVIDRTLDNVKKNVREMQKQFQEKVDEMAGEKKSKDSDAPSRLSKQELENAKTYEKRRKEQLEMERELRNQRLREEHMRKKQNTH